MQALAPSVRANAARNGEHAPFHITAVPRFVTALCHKPGELNESDKSAILFFKRTPDRFPGGWERNSGNAEERLPFSPERISGHGQRHGEHRAARLGVLRGDVPTVRFKNSAHDRESQAAAAGIP